jgi:thiol-disulfide isomerase/thioredoxin
MPALSLLSIFLKYNSMKKIITSMALMLAAAISNAQTTAMDFNTTDCNGNPAHLFSDLDSGKAVVLFYFMPSCGSCPPPAQKIQAMANNINASHPGKVKAYAFPFNNTTPCSYTQGWVTSNSLPLYAPMDSGATAVAYYGGFGMPTVVLVGGSTHRVMFSTLSFGTGDTLIMRDSILAMLGVTTPSAINQAATNANNVAIYPNPATGNVAISLDLKSQSELAIDVIDIMGKRVETICVQKSVIGNYTTSFNTESLANGVYTLRINVNGSIENRKLNVLH